MSKTTLSFSFDTETDRNLLRWLTQQENRSAAVREAISNHISHNGVTLGDIYQAIQSLKAEIGTRSFAAQSLPTLTDWPAEPTAAAAALDKLGTL